MDLSLICQHSFRIAIMSTIVNHFPVITVTVVTYNFFIVIMDWINISSSTLGTSSSKRIIHCFNEANKMNARESKIYI